jgi:hypothetical protein
MGASDLYQEMYRRRFGKDIEFRQKMYVTTQRSIQRYKDKDI